MRFAWDHRAAPINRQLRAAWPELPEDLRKHCTNLHRIRHGLTLTYIGIVITMLQMLGKGRVPFFNASLDFVIVLVAGVTYLVIVRAARVSTRVLHAYVDLFPHYEEAIVTVYDKPRITDIWSPWIRGKRSSLTILKRLSSVLPLPGPFTSEH